MKASYVGIASALSLLGILTAAFLMLSTRIEQRAVSASPTLFRGRPYVMKIHDYDSDKKSLVNANVVVELVQSGSLFATYTVDLIADPWCKTIPKEASMDLEINSIPMSLVSGTFGPMSNPKLNISIPENLDLAGRDFCVVISNDRRLSHSLTDAAKANLIVRFDVGKRNSSKCLSFLNYPENQFVVMAISFIVGFAVVLIPLVTTSKFHVIDHGKYVGPVKIESFEHKFNRYESWPRRNRGRAQHRTNLAIGKDEADQHKEKNICGSNVNESSRERVTSISEHPETNDRNADNERVFEDKRKILQEEPGHQRKASTDFSSHVTLIEDDNGVEGPQEVHNLQAVDGEPTRSGGEISDKGPVDTDYLVI